MPRPARAPPAPGQRSLVLLTPLLILRTLGLQGSERYAFVFVYVVGGLSPLASLLRYVFIRMGYVDNPAALVPGKAFFFAVDSLTLLEKIKLWTTVEAASGIVAFCLPSLRRLFKRGAVRLRSRGFLGMSAHSAPADDSYVSAAAGAGRGAPSVRASTASTAREGTLVGVDGLGRKVSEVSTNGEGSSNSSEDLVPVQL